MTLTTRLYRLVLRAVLAGYSAFLWLSALVPTRPERSGPKSMLVTGTFYSDHWLKTHLVPLGEASRCKQLIMVASTTVPEMAGVEARYPSARMQKLLGAVPARLLLFSYLALRHRPDYIAGFHLLLNGLFAVLLAKMTRRRSLYFCGGGPREVAGGGYQTENRIFNRIVEPDQFVERRLLAAVNKVDLVITMGQGAIDYFRARGVSANCKIMPGGFDEQSFYPPAKPAKEFDLILIGRLSSVKRVDLLLKATALAKQSKADIRVVIVGDGPDKDALVSQTAELQLQDNVVFAGWQDNVGDWLRKSRVFTLTSDSEGLSQALIQAMMCGLPAVVSNVGDLGDLVNNDQNGYLINERTPNAFSEKYLALLNDHAKLEAFATRAIERTELLKIPSVAGQWDMLLDAKDEEFT